MQLLCDSLKPPLTHCESPWVPSVWHTLSVTFLSWIMIWRSLSVFLWNPLWHTCCRLHLLGIFLTQPLCNHLNPPMTLCCRLHLPQVPAEHPPLLWLGGRVHCEPVSAHAHDHVHRQGNHLQVWSSLWTCLCACAWSCSPPRKPSSGLVVGVGLRVRWLRVCVCVCCASKWVPVSEYLVSVITTSYLCNFCTGILTCKSSSCPSYESNIMCHTSKIATLFATLLCSAYVNTMHWLFLWSACALSSIAFVQGLLSQLVGASVAPSSLGLTRIV